MKISKRLQTIADMISENSKVIDIGCDHALLDIYLSLYKNCHCIAADINENALEQAKYNIKRSGAKNIETVLTDGFDGIDISPQDIIVISGMGTTTIKHILSNNKASDCLIISTHNEWESLRKIVSSLGYKIIDEKFIIDKKKGYIIIKFIKGSADYSNEDLLYGPYLKNNREYLQALYHNTEDIMNKIPDENEDKDYMKKRLNEIQSLLEKIN